MSIESLPNHHHSREQANEIMREAFEKKAREVADKYQVSLSDILYLYAQKMGKQVEKNLSDELKLKKIFSDPTIEDIYWDAVEAEIQASIIEMRLKEEIAEKDLALNQEITRREAAEKAATIDHLTGLPNRRAFEAKLAEVISLHNEKQKIFSVILIDIDDFKGINDRFGHPIGDEVLRKIGQVIHHSLRGTDFAARYGGEEIAVIVEAGKNHAENLLNRIEAAISSIDPQTVNIDPKVRPRITASLGFAEYDPQTQNIPDQDVVSRADQAMYKIKQQKKAQITT